jgi:hypothetical protein
VHALSSETLLPAVLPLLKVKQLLCQYDRQPASHHYHRLQSSQPIQFDGSPGSGKEAAITGTQAQHNLKSFPCSAR